MKTYKAIAPAKVNLKLRVKKEINSQAKHDVENIMQTISLHDTLFVEVQDCCKQGAEFSEVISESFVSVDIDTNFVSVKPFSCDVKDNLITRAILSFYEAFHCNSDAHFQINLTKSIPAEAGLGGGSSDCAAMLKILCDLWSVDPSSKELLDVASKLGADVPYFLKGGRREMIGAGETEKREFESLKEPLVLIKPDRGVSTKEAYALFDKYETQDLITASKFQNDLQIPAIELCHEIREILECLPKDASMTGSGSCVFCVCDSFKEATQFATMAKLRGWWSRACSTVDLASQIVD